MCITKRYYNYSYYNNHYYNNHYYYYYNFAANIAVYRKHMGQ